MTEAENHWLHGTLHATVYEVDKLHSSSGNFLRKEAGLVWKELKKDQRCSSSLGQMLNAAAALLVSGRVNTLAEGISLARETQLLWKANRILDQWVALSNLMEFSSKVRFLISKQVKDKLSKLQQKDGFALLPTHPSSLHFLFRLPLLDSSKKK